MASGAANRVFVDTSVLVYSVISSAPLHGAALRSIQDLRLRGAELWISRQVLREYLAVLTRPQSFTQPLTISTLEADVVHFQAVFSVAEDGPAVTAELLMLLKTCPAGGKQIHDANIVATMLAHGLTELLTHNTADFARFSRRLGLLPLVP